MKKIFIILLSVFVFCACSKEDKDTNTPAGKWKQIQYADNPQFLNAKTLRSTYGDIIIELNNKDSCTYYVHNFEEGDILISKSICTFDNDFITVKKGMFSPCGNFYLYEGETILIYELTSEKMILKWNKDQIEKFGPENLTSSTYYTELKRIE